MCTISATNKLHVKHNDKKKWKLKQTQHNNIQKEEFYAPDSNSPSIESLTVEVGVAAAPDVVPVVGLLPDATTAAVAFFLGNGNDMCFALIDSEAAVGDPSPLSAATPAASMLPGALALEGATPIELRSLGGRVFEGAGCS